MIGRYPVLVSCVQYDGPLKAGAMAPAAVAERAAELGADGVEYREVYWRDKGRELPAARAALQRLGLQASYATFNPLLAAEPAARAALLTDIDDALALGSPLLRVFRGPLPAEPAATAAAWEGAQLALARAAEHGLRLALENHINVLGSRLADVLGTLAMLDSQVMGANVDTANYVQNDEPLLPAIERLRPWIVYAHLKDVRRTAGGLEVVSIGRGELDFGAIMAAFDEVPEAFPLCFEFPGGDEPEAAIADSLAALARLRP